MTTLERISILESIVSGFVTADNSRWNRRKLIAILNEGRAIGISNSHQGGTRIHPDWIQPFKLDYDEAVQESDCYSTFVCPSVIKLTKLKDGFIQIGNKDGSVNYDRVNTMGEFNNMKNHPILSRAMTQRVAAIYEDGVWKVFQNKNDGKIRSFAGRAIFNDPTDLSDFNLVKDKYPIDETTFEFVCGYLKEKYLNQIQGTQITSEKTDIQPQFSIPKNRR